MSTRQFAKDSFGEAIEAPRVVIYSRVSKKDQQAKNQLIGLREFAKRSNWHLIAEYVDHETGATSDRPQFQQMMEDAGQRTFDIVLFWSLDRFTREGVSRTFDHLARLKAYGVKFHNYSLPEASSEHPFADVFMAISAQWAKIEREQISSRTKAGMVRAAQEGRFPGRPHTIIDGRVVSEMVDKGHSFTEIGAKLGTTRFTIKRRYDAWLNQAKRAEQAAS